MRILHIIASAQRMGGPIQGVSQIAHTLVKRGHTVELATLDSPNDSFLKGDDLPVHALGPAWGNYRFEPRFTDWVARHAGEYDGVVINGIWQYHSFGAWRALRNKKIPYVVFPHGMLNPWFKTTYPVKHLKKRLYWPWAEYKVLRDASAVLFTSEEERRLARQSFALYQCNELVVSYGSEIPEGDSIRQKRAFLGQFPELGGKRIALFMGRLHPVKACDVVIQAFAKVLRSEEWRLVMAGPDQTGWRPELMRQAQSLGVDSRITWTGALDGLVKFGAFHAAEILVMPSHCENFGIVAAEAMACGVPVLLSNKVNIWREIEMDGAGIAGEDDFEGTCAILKTYLGLPEEKRVEMRACATQCFRNRFEISRAAEALRSILSNLPRLPLRAAHHALFDPSAAG